METIRLPVLLVGLLHLSLAFPHATDHGENCTTDERVSFIIKSGTSEGNFKPEVTPLNNTRLLVVGDPRGEVVEEMKNGIKYTTIKTSVTVVISPPPTTSPPITITEETTTQETITQETTTEKTITQETTTEETTTTSSPVHEDPGEFIMISGFGSYKFHKSQPIDKMMKICKEEKAVVAYPIYLEEVDDIVKNFKTPENYLIVGIKRNDSGIFNFEDEIAYFNENLWDSKHPSNVGNCTALNLDSKRLKNISCSENLPFLCKKDDGFERGYGFYTHHGPALIDYMERICQKKDRTVAVPQSPEEAEVMASHALDTDRYLSVGLRKAYDPEQYMRVGRRIKVNENESDFEYVNISTNLLDGGKLSGSGECLVLNKDSQRLIGNRCDVKFSFICKKDLIPPDSVEFIDKHIYQYQPWYKAASEVTASCKAKNFTAVAFPIGRDFATKADKLANLIPDDEPEDIATGIKRIKRDESGDIYEILGLQRRIQPNLSDFWENGKPNYDGDCIKLSQKSHKFQDYNCSKPLPYICVIYKY